MLSESTSQIIIGKHFEVTSLITGKFLRSPISIHWPFDMYNKLASKLYQIITSYNTLVIDEVSHTTKSYPIIGKLSKKIVKRLLSGIFIWLLEVPMYF